MGYEGQDFSEIAGGVSPAFVETLYKRFKDVARLASSRRGAAGSRGWRAAAPGPSWAQPRLAADRPPTT